MSVVPFETIVNLAPVCECCGERVTRVIALSTTWNESGADLFHCMRSGRIEPIRDLAEVVRSGRQESGAYA